MADIENAIKEHYSSNLRADLYLNFVDDVFKLDSGYVRNPSTFIYDILQSGKFKGSRLLDLCCGPVFHNVALPSAFYPNILMADYVEDNCEEVKRWLRGETKLKQILHFAAEIEGYGKDMEAGQQLIEKRIRKCVKQVVRCDILTDKIFMENVKPEVAPPYDLIIAAWCVECAVSDLSSYIRALKRINKLLRVGGGLIMMGEFDKKNWKAGNKEFNAIKLTETHVREALKESEFGIADLKIYHHYEQKSETDPEKIRMDYFGIAAEKL